MSLEVSHYMSRHPRRMNAADLILARLHCGPLPCDEAAGLSKNRETLRVQIRYLRRRGYEIETVRAEKGSGRHWRAGVYILRGCPI